jgi:membrane-associated protease RseP (regulator of RpoE activity)
MPKDRLWLHVLLFVATLGTTTFVGQGAGSLTDGLLYSLSIMAILLAHEMGHYVTARRRGVDASLPFFLPMPLPGTFGTFGAFIRMRLTERVPGDDLLKIGAYGPLAGFVVALPVLSVGLLLSDVKPVPEMAGTAIMLGDSLLLLGLERIFFGDLAEGMDVWLHPMAYAGWVGMLFTSLNLLPLSQLDGGHIAYCMMGDRFNKLVPVFFVLLAVATLLIFPGWTLLCIFILVIGAKHPPICTDVPISGRSRWIGVACAAVFVLTFTPVPFLNVMPTLLDLF